jgi:hypothetical protein
MAIIQELDKEEVTFQTFEAAIAHIKNNNLMSYSIRDEKELFIFFGGTCIYADAIGFLKLGSKVFKKG